MGLTSKLVSIGVVVGAVGITAAKLVDIAYNKIGGKYITFTGNDYNHIPEEYDEENKDQEL